MFKFTIDRTIWLRGVGGGNSWLRQEENGKMCCVGIFLGACGVKNDRLNGFGTASQMINFGMARSDENFMLPDMARFLIEGHENDGNGVQNSGIASELYHANDLILGDAEREASLIALFAKAGIEVTFIN